jgi:hypothetical protein
LFHPLDEHLAGAEGGPVEFIGILLRILDEFPEILHGHRGMRHQHVLDVDHVGHGREVFVRIVGNLADQRQDGRVVPQQHAHGVAVGPRAGAGFGGNDEIGAGAVLDQQGLADARGKRL